VIDALLLDLGNVVLEVDFRRTFRHWAASAAVDPARLQERWAEDEAYRAHERGELSFEAYTAALGDRLGIDLSAQAWAAGWNDIFVGPYEHVQAKLAELSGQLPLYAFTNTNATHELTWRSRYPHAFAHFDGIFVSSTIGLRKPDYDAFQWVARAMEVSPERILFLDDNRENIAGAQAAGMQTEWIRSEADVIDVLSRF